MKKTIIIPIFILMFVFPAISISAENYEMINTDTFFDTHYTDNCQTDTSIASTNIYSDEKYIFIHENGLALTWPSSSMVTATDFSAENHNDHQTQKWKYLLKRDGSYSIHPVSNIAYCLSYNEITSRIEIALYQDFSAQRWNFHTDGELTTIQSAKTGTNLYYIDSNWELNNSSCTQFGFFSTGLYQASTYLYQSSFYLAPEQTIAMNPGRLPVLNNSISSNWYDWSCSAPYASIDANGHITGQSSGTMTVTFTDRISKISGSCQVTVTEVANATYYIQNRQNTDCVMISNSRLIDGQTIVQYELSPSQFERWDFVLNNNTGYYSIRTVASTDPYYLAISNSGTEESLAAVIYHASSTENMTDSMWWKVELTSEGHYKLSPKSGYANGFVLATSHEWKINNIIIIQDEYSDNTNYQDEWKLERLLPTNGCELAYTPQLWTELSSMFNCYGYALNNQTQDRGENSICYKQQPGEYYNEHRFENEEPLMLEGGHTKENIWEKVVKDFIAYQRTTGIFVSIQEIGRYDVCPPGTYKIALVVEPYYYDNDYHWYRQDADGLWSHKPGPSLVTRLDYSNQLIIDPQTADRTTNEDARKYSIFCGYYAITPWNNIYDPLPSQSSSDDALLSLLSPTMSGLLANRATLTSIEVGMRLEEVITLVGYAGVDVGSGLMIHKYTDENETTYYITYSVDEHGFYVSSIRVVYPIA